MATHLLQLRRYSETGVLLATSDLNQVGAVGQYGFYLKDRKVSFLKYKDVWQNSPVLDGRRLVDYRYDVQVETITVDALASSTTQLQFALTVLNAWTRIVRDGQKKKNRGLPYVSTQLWANPLQGLAAASHTEVLAMDVDGIDNYFGPNIVANRAENIVITLTLAPYWTASELDLVTDASVSNGAANYIQVTDDSATYTVNSASITSNVATLILTGNHSMVVGDWFTASNVALDAAFNGLWKITAATAADALSFASTNTDIVSATSTGDVEGQYVKGSRSAPSRHKVAGGTSATDRLIVGVRKQGNVQNFTTHHLWAKDATLTNNTAAATAADGAFDGDGTGDRTRTTAASTSELKTHRWIVTSNPIDQYGTFNVYLRCRSNTASRYSARFRVGTTDGTNVSYPLQEAGGYSISTAAAIGTHASNALAFVDLGTITMPPILASGATLYGLVYELYLTCSNTTGSPTLDVDAVYLFPVGEGEDGTGYMTAKYGLGTAATAVGSGFISALTNEPSAYLASTADVITFPTQQIEGAGIMLEPAREYRIYYALVDESTSAGNPRHDWTQTLTVSVDYEVRYGIEGKL